MNEQIFDILGIGTREDSFTDLIRFALQENETFAEAFYRKVLRIPAGGKWRVSGRKPFSTFERESRSKGAPDILLINEDLNRVVIIENKLFSREGNKQTERYSSEKFRTAIADKEGMTNPRFSFFYLCIEKENSLSSEEFEPITYEDLATCISKKPNPTCDLDRLLNDLRNRIDHYYAWPPPVQQDKVADYLLRKRKWWVVPRKTFAELVKAVSIPNFKSSPYPDITAHGGNLLTKWWRKGWVAGNAENCSDGHECFNIHFELQWDSKENLTLYLHYETQPYRTWKDLEKLNQHVSKSFLDHQNRFRRFINENCPQDWSPCKARKKMSLQVAKINLWRKGQPGNLRFGELEAVIIKSVTSMADVVDRYITSS